MRNAYLAGTAIAVASGLVGYFVVLRGQVFTGDALSHVAFTGALAALAFGIDARLGLFTAVIFVALIMGALGDRGRADDVVIGGIFAWILGLGVLFLSLFTTRHSTGNSTAGVSVLFGSIFGLNQPTNHRRRRDRAHRRRRPPTHRPTPAVRQRRCRHRRRPRRTRTRLGYVFLVLVGLTAAEATQAVGALLLLGLLAAPAAAAQKLTDRPYRALLISALFAVASMWIGLALSYRIPSWPPSFAIVATLTVGYIAAAVASATRSSPSTRTMTAAPPQRALHAAEPRS